MPSRFPGMDPYLEGHLWPDVHQALANRIRQQLAPLVKPRYVARLAVYVVEDVLPEAEVGLMYPDVEVLAAKGGDLREPPPAPLPIIEATADTPDAPAPLIIPLPHPEVRLVTVEVRDADFNQLVTSIEILSPINKREPGLTQYLYKRRRLHRAGVHVLEIDLLRRGTRTLSHSRLSNASYLVSLIRAHSGVAEVWPLRLPDRLPTVPVPLRDPDPDVSLALSPALAAIYDEAAYELSVDYSQPPPPPALSAEDAAWLKALVGA